MSRPNLNDPVERAAYRRELLGLYKPWRWLGLASVVAGVMVMFTRDGRFDAWSIGLLVAGWTMLIAVIIQRTRYHRRRMRED